jgi:hypothetical protein
MVRISKQAERRSVSRKRTKAPAKKTGPKKDALPQGFKPHANAIGGDLAACAFIPQVK